MGFLTKTNFRGSLLLTRVEGRSTKRQARYSTGGDDSSSDPLSMSDVSPAKKRKKGKPEPATDDDPISSSNDSDSPRLSNGTPKPRHRPRTEFTPGDLEADLAAIDADATPKPRKKAISTPRVGERRSKRISNVGITAQDANASKDASNEHSPGSRAFGDSLVFFSRVPKKGKTYQRNPFNNVHTPTKTEKKHEFIVPRNGPDIPDTVRTQKPSDNPEFKVPMAIPNDSFSSASFPTDDSSREVPETFVFDDHSGSSSPLSSVAPSNMDLTVDEKRFLDAASGDFVRCQACRELLDPEYLAEFQLEKGVSVRRQMQACQQHKRWTAERDWRQRDYPTIDWEGLEDRIQAYFAELDQILTRKKPSFFRNFLESSNTGNSKKDNFRLTANSQFEMMSSGYYGPRGARLMMDAIITKFAAKLRRLGPSDSLMQAAGASGFVQAVLVPELTVMLVKDDMGVGDETARQIMRESNMIGNLLNDQPDDDVKVDEDGNSRN
ncbi:hypothetical protein D8B26_003944 [Coccidioides posadasii str. Silveira]|uniref:Restriction of telomere capping protein 4 n=2 Tax=Coccidioides posadasii TaxID=199306 RepID=E9D9H1_COCPS|nr:conserved hypothetical protein [Coccidioides posadasii str. Silveira]KMM70113.1 hypothetical protein CPAG_06426 [Coccidioides posadasii RMSCC 3488]QVM09281.1 hypothetical protein D8B26_003944 [Coccidioides posadasii str. Silveira]